MLPLMHMWGKFRILITDRLVILTDVFGLCPPSLQPNPVIAFWRVNGMLLPYPSLFIIHSRSPIRCSGDNHHLAYISVNEPGLWCSFKCFVMSQFRYSEWKERSPMDGKFHNKNGHNMHINCWCFKYRSRLPLNIVLFLKPSTTSVVEVM
jgi:hypothetical protein